MSKGLRKRTLREFCDREGGACTIGIFGKQLNGVPSFQMPDFHLNNLKTLFPDIEDESLRNIYEQSNCSISSTIDTLERMQRNQKSDLRNQSEPSKQSQENPEEERAIDSEIKQEMNGINQNTNLVLQKLGHRANDHISQAVTDLSSCQDRQQASAVLENFLNSVLQETLEVQKTEIAKSHSRYFVAKKAVHFLNDSISKRNQELFHLRTVVDRQFSEINKLKEMNKYLLKENESLQQMSGGQGGGGRPFFEPDRGVF